MSKIPTFGFSAFLRIISLNERPQKTAIRNRHRPVENKGGYDFHRSLRTAINELATGKSNLSDTLAKISSIPKLPERRSAKRGVVRFLRWIKNHSGAVSFCDPIVIDSPSGLFRIRFEADFVVEIAGRRTAVHVWNTKSPKLNKSHVIAALTIVQKHWPKNLDNVDDFAVLSLQDNRFFAWSDETNAYSGLADAILLHLDQLSALSRVEFGLPPISRGIDGPDPGGIFS